MGFNISELEWHNVLDKIKTIETKNKKLEALIKEQKKALTIHIVSNALFCENCNGSHMHTRYGNVELMCDNCDNVAKL
jgi:hypothetical protein